MTPQQQVTVAQIIVWVGTAQELLQQAQAAVYAPGMDGAVPFPAVAAIGNAANRAKDAVEELTPLMQTMEVTA